MANRGSVKKTCSAIRVDAECPRQARAAKTRGNDNASVNAGNGSGAFAHRARHEGITALGAGKVALLAAAFLFGIVILASLALPQPNFELSNASKKKSVRISMEVANDSLSQMRGLMFREEIVPILFVFGYDGIFPIHSYFVKGEFDAVYISNEGKVTEIYRRVPPNVPLLKPKKNSAYLLELPPGITDRLAIEEGDIVRWREIRR